MIIIIIKRFCFGREGGGELGLAGLHLEIVPRGGGGGGAK